MKKLLLVTTLTGLVSVSSVSHAAELTVNPLLGVSHNKAFKSNVAAGIELGYSDVLFGYTYTGGANSSQLSESVGLEKSSAQVNAYSDDKYKAHSLYVGYQFAVGRGHLAVKAGADFSKYRANAGFQAATMPGSAVQADMGLGLNASSSYEFSPMVGIGYYLNNGFNFNLHYTFQSGDRDMKVNGSGYINNDKGSMSSKRFKNGYDNKDLGTVMFTVGYRF
ncbi:hypothetical protein [Shewanella waksmanii]|uniref:hypothetical protein n=1 Tax=Shewanella waksmanii TaxID=213783 RepID=UPI000491C034|nr:hypothetical protein [Shewanella waksmanii]